MRILFIANLCPMYRVRPFELLASRHDVTYCFFSNGGEAYWDRNRGEGTLRAHHIRLAGFSPIRGVRVTPGLFPLIMQGKWDAIIKCVNGKFALPATYALARMKKIPFILWTETWMTPRSFLHRVGAPVVRRIYRGSDALCVCGPHVTAYLEEQGVDPGKVYEVPQNVDADVFERPVQTGKEQAWRERLHLGLSPVVLYIGRLVPEKGLGDLIRAMSAFGPRTGALLVLVGEGPQKAELESMAEELMPGRVRFTGDIPNGELPELIHLAHCLVLPSRSTRMYREVWGLVVNEAFHQGTPVVVSDAVGAAAAGLVRNGRNGFIFPEGDVAALRQSLESLLHNPPLRARFSAVAREDVRAWSPKAMVDGFCRAIEAVTRTRSGRTSR